MPPTRSSTTSAAAGLDALLRKIHEETNRTPPKGSFTAIQYAAVNDMPENTARLEINRLVDKGRLRAVGIFPVKHGIRINHTTHFAVVK